MFHSMDTKSDGNTDDGLDLFLRGMKANTSFLFQKRFDYGAYDTKETYNSQSQCRHLYLSRSSIKIAELREHL